MDFRLGKVLVNPRAATLRIGEDERRVDYKAMQVLLCLASRPGEKVPKREILDTVWAGKAVCDEVLTVAVSTLRRALDDDPKEPSFIQTIPRVGYRLVAPITRADPPARPRPWAAPFAAALLALAGLAWQSRSAGPPEAKVVRAVAVLPFANDTGDPHQEHLADGATQAVITGLSREGLLRVTPRRSAMPLKQSRRSLSKIARDLRVDTVVEGSIQRSRNRFRISATLVDAHRERTLWATTRDAADDDLLAAQEHIAQAVLDHLLLTDRPRLAAGRPTPRPADPAAHRAYLRGRALAGQCLEDTSRADRALAELHRAVELDPGFAAAHASLASTYAGLALRGGGDHLAPAAAARQAAATALARDPSLAAAHAVQGVLLSVFDWNFTAAENAFRRALRFDPENTQAHYWYSQHLASQGRFAEALAHIRQLQDLDPKAYLDPMAAGLLYRARRYDLAIAELQAEIDLAGESPRPHVLRAEILGRLGRPAAAVADLKRALELQGAGRGTLHEIDRALTSGGLDGVYGWMLARYRDRPRDLGPVARAHLLIGAGESQPALDWLERAFESRDPGLVRISSDPAFDRVRHEPRFRRLLEHIGLARLESPQAPVWSGLPRENGQRILPIGSVGPF